MNQPILQVSDLAIGYAQQALVTDINFTLQAGQICCLLGNNGCGKTTLLKTILAILPALKGECYIENQAIKQLSPAALARYISYVPQATNPTFNFVVTDMVLMGRTAHLAWYQQPSKHDYAVVYQTLAALNIEHLAHKYYAAISGGERQMVLIARALCQQPKVIIMDEPASNLDFSNQLKLIEQVKLLRQNNLVVMVSTHNPQTAWQIADNLLLFKPKQIQFGNTTELMTIANMASMYQVAPQLIEQYFDFLT